MSDNYIAPKPENDIWDVSIIGSGPSALTAAIYTTRGASSTLILAGDTWGGQLMLTTTVDNFPGFPDGIDGPTLMENMKKQALRFGADWKDQKLLTLEKSGDIFILKTEKEEFKSRCVIVATGADTKWLGVPGEEKLRGRGVSSCAPCDAPFFKDKKVAVIGGGDSAMEEALVISKYASEVFVIHRRDAFKASAAMQEKVLNHPKIKVIWKTKVNEMLGEEKLTALKIETEGEGERIFELDGVFVAIGHSPSTKNFSGVLDMDELGYLIRSPKDGFEMSTNIPGVFTAGDVHDRHYRQAITASGFGAMSALDSLKFLDKDIPTW